VTGSSTLQADPSDSAVRQLVIGLPAVALIELGLDGEAASAVVEDTREPLREARVLPPRPPDSRITPRSSK
jgi:hypothetical protein